MKFRLFQKNVAIAVDSIMDFNRAELIFITPVLANKMQFFSYIILRLTYVRGVILEFGRNSSDGHVDVNHICVPGHNRI